MNFKKTPCKICDSQNTYLYCKKEHYDIIKCKDCGCGFLDLSDKRFNIISFYQDYYKEKKEIHRESGYDNYFALEKPLKLTFQKRLYKLLNYTVPYSNRMNLLEIGCGPGFFLEIASKYFNTFGIEISKQATDYGKNKLNLNIINDCFRSGIYTQDKFDLVTLWDTIEHIDDPEKLLNEIYSILKEDGILAFTTGDFDSLMSMISKRKWHLLTVPEHLFFFSKKGIKRLLREYNYEIIYLGYPSNFVTIDYVLERLVKSLEFANSYRKRAKIRKLLNNFILKTNLFDVMFVIAIKRSPDWFKINSKKKVIVNADDFGLSKGINEGIINAHKNGIVSSASIITAGKYADDAIKLAKENTSLEIGIHLVLVEEKPISAPNEIPSLVNSRGYFFSGYFEFIVRYLTKKIDVKDIEKEFRAQIEKLKLSKLVISHIDSHQYLHMFPPILKVVVKLAKEYNINFIRLPRANCPIFDFKELFLYLLSILSFKYLLKNKLNFVNRVEGINTAGRLTTKRLKKTLSKLKNGVTEIICHPGFADKEYINNYSHWGYRPESEMQSLCDPQLKNFLLDNEIVVTNNKSD